MTNLIRSFLAVSVLTIGLSACADNGNNNTTTPPVPPPVVTPPPPSVDSRVQLRVVFRDQVSMLTRSAQSTDAVPCPDLAPLSLTTKPVAL